MLKAWMKYLILSFLIENIYLYIGGYVFFILYVIFLSLPFISLLGMLWMKASLKYSLIDGILSIDSKSIFPFMYISASYELENIFSNTKIQNSFINTLGGKKHYEIPLHEPQIGKYRCQKIHIKVYDGLMLFAKSLDVLKDTHYLIPVANKQVTYQVKELSLKQKKESYLEDQHEVIPYKPGDQLKYIHHKMSHKKQMLMLRKFEHQKKQSYQIYLDLSCDVQDCEDILNVCREIIYTFDKTNIEVMWDTSVGRKTVYITHQYQLDHVFEIILSHPKTNVSCDHIETHMMIASKDGEVIVYE